MLDLTKLKALISNTPTDPTEEDFINIHKGVEGYIRRLLLIGLRLNNVKYSTAQEVIKMSYLNNRDLFKKTIELVTKKTKTISDFEAANPDLKELMDLFFDFTSILRNRILHGVDEKIHNAIALKHAYYIDKYLVDEMEASLSTFGFKSAFDEPNKWGALTVKSTETFSAVITRLKLGKLTKNVLGMIAVKNAISKTKYNGKI